MDTITHESYSLAYMIIYGMNGYLKFFPLYHPYLSFPA